MLKTKALFIMAFTIFSFACNKNSVPLQTVPKVDLKQYMGKWYEIATIPQKFQKGCVCTTAEYTLTDKGYVNVVNSCRKETPEGEINQIEGKAFVVKKSNGAKLKVQFFWPFKGKYWIIQLADDYSWAVVGHPKRTYLWILSRTPRMKEETYHSIVKKLKKQKYNTKLLVRTNQNCNI
ncbi:MAG TPA: lipocalin family protein [Bacteroidales bacterium]|nr:lipocalin family protein [Bacteroidales bacterium]